MANSERLRLNKNQHVVKNLLSKGDDKKVVEAMMHVIEYMNTRFPLKDMGYRPDYVDRITLRELTDIISSYETRFEFSALSKEGSFIKPDGGILLLKKEDDTSFQRIVLAVEMKRQGTNDQRAPEGKGKKSQGNEIERLGTNQIGFRSELQDQRMMNVVCFG